MRKTKRMRWVEFSDGWLCRSQSPFRSELDHPQQVLDRGLAPIPEVLASVRRVACLARRTSGWDWRCGDGGAARQRSGRKQREGALARWRPSYVACEVPGHLLRWKLDGCFCTQSCRSCSGSFPDLPRRSVAVFPLQADVSTFHQETWQPRRIPDQVGPAEAGLECCDRKACSQSLVVSADCYPFV